ncbi:DUF4136 domain-containing protein [Formosa sediminum]|uniref:DUF4136 domain-containing protein n=1 Tax=Formosa sediminum TaxID=2594004 RepID=A0A516GMI1_9FLAO|nr:DUF4136 domain-containing protein [Formosa sediminum]QDO92732.1 DUF4136 domain-containing protein [Formosa sediminum]
MKKILKFLPVLVILLLLSSCSSVKVASDYDKSTTFDQYKTFAFYKTGIDKAEINDIDKRRILHAIEAELTAKGYTKSENPDILISIFTKAREQVNVYNNNMGWGPYGYGWGWSPYYYNNFNNTSVTRSTEGTLFIDLIDATKKELVWQGVGSGVLNDNINKKEERIQEFVNKILENYPPELKK